MSSTVDYHRLPVSALAVALSAVFSAWIIYSDPVLNDDAFNYLRAAEVFSAQGLDTVLDRYGWYAYSVLIALFDNILPGGLPASAYLINTLCYMLMTWAFIALSRELDPSPRRTVIAAIVILGFPLINEMRDYIIRDAAYWALSLAALLNLVRYSREARLGNAIGWSVCTLLAVAFRLEALLPTLFAPLALLCSGADRRARLRLLGRLAAILAASVLLITLSCLAFGINLLDIMQFAYRYYLPPLYDFWPLLRDSALALNAAIFVQGNFPGHESIAFGVTLLSISYLLAVLVNLITALSLPVSLVLLLCLFRQGPGLPRHAGPALIIYGACALLSLLIFQFIMHFQTHRYAALLSLLLLLLLPGVIEQLLDKAAARDREKLFRSAAGFACVYFFVDSLISFGHSKQYVLEASEWVESNIPETAEVGTNVLTIAYERGYSDDFNLISRNAGDILANAGAFDYLALEIKDDDVMEGGLDKTEHLQLLNSFANSRGDEIRIYRRP